MKAVAVIGAAFGDEGKGLMTDYFCRQYSKPPIVVRYNGGAQAGHTVVTDKRRHVFSHIGSGYFTGADTFLSKFFLVNPAAFRIECSELGKYTEGRVYVHPNALVSTVYDSFINQELEKSRGDSRHGSCGMGINETIQRSKVAGFVLTASDLYAHDLIDKVVRVQNWARIRLQQCNLLNKETEAWIRDPAITRTFIDDCRSFADNVQYSSGMVLNGRNVVFEGAQGLLLDANSYFFPHVTHSYTGLRNIVAIAEDLGIDEIDATYVMRTYLTRHGAGPLPGEDSNLNYLDTTNNKNAWQGSLRFARQDNELMSKAIIKDLIIRKYTTVKINPDIALTHVDQEGFIPRIQDVLVRYNSDGPTADHVGRL